MTKGERQWLRAGRIRGDQRVGVLAQVDPLFNLGVGLVPQCDAHPTTARGECRASSTRAWSARIGSTCWPAAAWCPARSSTGVREVQRSVRAVWKAPVSQMAPSQASATRCGHHRMGRAHPAVRWRQLFPAARNSRITPLSSTASHHRNPIAPLASIFVAVARPEAAGTAPPRMRHSPAGAHRAPQADSSISFSLSPASGSSTAATQTVCPGTAYNVRVRHRVSAMHACHINAPGPIIWGATGV